MCVDENCHKLHDYDGGAQGRSTPVRVSLRIQAPAAFWHTTKRSRVVESSVPPICSATDFCGGRSACSGRITSSESNGTKTVCTRSKLTAYGLANPAHVFNGFPFLSGTAHASTMPP